MKPVRATRGSHCTVALVAASWALAGSLLRDAWSADDSAFAAARIGSQQSLAAGSRRGARRGRLAAAEVGDGDSVSSHRRGSRACGRPALPGAFATYDYLLLTFPLATKTITSSILWAVGDMMSQMSSFDSSRFDYKRLLNCMIIGFGNAVIMSFWYANLQSCVESVAPDPNMQVVLSVVLEQFFCCPFLYGLYLIPLSTFLNGGGADEARGEVQSRLVDMLVANAKLWTFANLIVYSLPVEWRVLGGNVFEVFWAAYCAGVAADCGGSAALAQGKEEACFIPEQQYARQSS